MNKPNKAKYKNAILYFANGLKNNITDDLKPDKIKIAKLLYYLDFINFRDKGKSITGTIYYKQAFGPLPKDYAEMIEELVTDGKIEVSERAVSIEGANKIIKTDILLTKNNLKLNDIFNNDEQILARKILNKYKDWKTEEISAKSHLETPWANAKYGLVLDFNLAEDIDDFDNEKEKYYKQEEKIIIGAIQKASESIIKK